METSKHTVWVRLKIEAASKEAAEAIAAQLMRVGMEHAQNVEPVASARLTYWGLKK